MLKSVAQCRMLLDYSISLYQNVNIDTPPSIVHQVPQDTFQHNELSLQNQFLKNYLMQQPIKKNRATSILTPRQAHLVFR